jgi:hypothetical protein
MGKSTQTKKICEAIFWSCREPSPNPPAVGTKC